MEKQRLAGIDLVRGLAVYGVVILHSDQGVRTLPESWTAIRQISEAFAVPFFLATSFYLAAGKLYADKKPYPLQTRFIRLLAPYSFWSLFYLLYKSLKYLADKDLDRVKHLFQDPLSIIFFGGAAFHLYFLPLLLTGTLLMKPAEILIRRQSLKFLLVLIVSSLVLCEAVTLTGNGFNNEVGIAFQPLARLIFSSEDQNPALRVLLVELAWVIRCVPYVLIAVLLNQPAIALRLQKVLKRYLAIWLMAFLVVSSLGSLFLPGSIHDVAMGYTALLFAIALSHHLKESSLLKNLGLCSFGIYLIHLLFVEISQSLMIRLEPEYIDHVSTATLLAISIAIFLVSWGATAVLIRHKQLSRVLV